MKGIAETTGESINPSDGHVARLAGKRWISRISEWFRGEGKGGNGQSAVLEGEA